MTGVVNSTGAVSGVIGTTVGTPAGNNIKNAVIFGLNGDEAVTSDGSSTTITDWTKFSNECLGELGTFAAPSSGVFTFPRTGYYLIIAHITHWSTHANGQSNIEFDIRGTDDDDTYNRISYTRANDISNGSYYMGAGMCACVVDITSTSTHKVRMKYSSGTSGTYLGGGVGQNGTSITFIHLGDT